MFAIGAGGCSVEVFDARTGDKLRDVRARAEARRDAEKRRRAAEEDIERLKALLTRG